MRFTKLTVFVISVILFSALVAGCGAPPTTANSSSPGDPQIKVYSATGKQPKAPPPPPKPPM
jgi:hypothetical protein